MNKQNSRISVIIPVYQAEHFLPRCMESVFAQTLPADEVILVDDGSEDAGGMLCDAYAGQDARVRVIHQENRGLSTARNTGIVHAKGEWIAFIDADDAVSPWYLEYLYQGAVLWNCSISQCSFEPFSEELPEPERWDGTCQVFDGEAMQWRICSPDRQVYLESTVSWNKLYRRELFDKIRFPEGKIHEDEAISYRLYAQAGQIAVLSCRLYWYYRNPEGIMGQKMRAQRLDYVEILAERYRFYKSRKQEALAGHTGKQLYTVLVDLASLKSHDVEGYRAFRKRLQILCRRYADICLREMPGRKERVRIRLSVVSVSMLTARFHIWKIS